MHENYHAHAIGARRLAEEYFHSKKVLADLLERVA
jgi:hypothetical protein